MSEHGTGLDPERCADCGAIVEWYPPRDRWGSRIANIANDEGFDAWSFTCRTELQGGLLVSADYHYVQGETQRHFRLGLP